MKLKIIKIGNSKGVILPKKIIKEHEQNSYIEISFNKSNNKVITEIDYTEIRSIIKEELERVLRELCP